MPLSNSLKQCLVHGALELMPHPFDATAAQVDVVGALRNHWALDLDDSDNSFGDNVRTDTAGVTRGWADIRVIITE